MLKYRETGGIKVRRIGIDISTARLQQELYNLGIQENVNNLTQADKALLRYIATMNQTTNAQADLARTLQTPANQLRILTAQLNLAGRAIGSVFIPALTSVLPYVIAFVQVIREAATSLASFLGFELPEIDYSGLENASVSVGAASDEMNDLSGSTSKAAKEMNKLISGFDELNILEKNTGSAGAGGVGGSTAGNILGDIELPQYDMFAGAVENSVDSIVKKMKELIQAFENDPLTVVSDGITSLVGSLFNLSGVMNSTNFPALITGLGAAFAAYNLTGNPAIAIAVGALSAVLSSFLPQESKIDAMSGTLSTLAIALGINMVSGGKVSVPLAMGISALLQSGLIQLLGKDAALGTLATGLTAVGAALAAYKLTKGNVGIAIGIGAVTAALTGLASSNKDLQAVPSLLLGLTASMASLRTQWKGGKKDIEAVTKIFPSLRSNASAVTKVLPALAAGLGGVSIGFAQLNQDLPNELQIALTGVGGALEGLAFGFQSFGIKGAIIGAVAGALVGLYTAIEQVKTELKEADLEKHFGDISLSLEEVEDIATRLTTNEWTIQIDAYTNAKEELESMESSLNETLADINKLSWKVSIGLDLTDSEKEQFVQSVNDFIDQSQQQLEQKQYTVSLALNASFASGSETLSRLTEFSNEYYGGLGAELQQLGIQLSDLMNESFANNSFDLNQEEINEMVKRIQEINQQIQGIQFQASVEAMSLEIGDLDLTADSYKQINEKVNERLASLKEEQAEIRIDTLATLDLEYKANIDSGMAEEEAKRIYEESKDEMERYFDSQNATLYLEGINIGIDPILNNYKEELDKAMPEMMGEFGDALEAGMEDAINTGDWGQFFMEFTNEFRNGAQSLSWETKQNISDLLSILEPEQSELEAIAKRYREAGKLVPESIAEGLNTLYSLQALTGNTDAIYKLMGMEMEENPEYAAALETARAQGVQIPQEIIDGFLLGSDELTEGTENLFTIIETASQDAYARVEGQFQTMGITLPSLIINNIALKNDDAQQAVFDLFAALERGESQKAPELKELFSTFGIELPESMINSIESMNAVAQEATIILLSQLESGVSLKQEELNSLFANLGWELPDTLISSLSSKSGPVQQEALNLLGQISQTATNQRQPLIDQLNQLGVDVAGLGLAEGIKMSTPEVKQAGKDLVEGATEGAQDKVTSQKNQWKNIGETLGTYFREGILGVVGAIKITSSLITGSGRSASYSANSVEGRTISTPRSTYAHDVTKFASGGVVDEPTFALVGEYQDAKNDPEVIAPRSTIEQSVINANGELVSAMYQMAQMIVAAYREGQNVTLEVDGSEIGRAATNYINSETRRTGKNPVMA